MLERNNKSGVSRINGYRDKTGGRQTRYEHKYAAYDKEAATKKKSERADKIIEHDDERYRSLTTAFMNTIHAREINVLAIDFGEKMAEILQTIYQSKMFEMRYKNDDKQRVNNAILRAVNKERERIKKELKKSEKGRDDE